MARRGGKVGQIKLATFKGSKLGKRQRAQVIKATLDKMQEEGVNMFTWLDIRLGKKKATTIEEKAWVKLYNESLKGHIKGIIKARGKK